MCKRIVLVAAVLFAACGTEPSSQTNPGGTDQPTGPKISQVPGRALGVASFEMKVALRVTTALYTQVTYNPSGDGETFEPLPCAVGCATGQVCHENFCSVQSFKNVDFYAKNIPVPTPANPPPFPVPCDGRLYSALIIGAFPEAAGGPYQIQEAFASTPFTVDANCNVSGLAWAPATLPDAIFPPIYAGLGAPFDTYTVRFSGLVNPWSSDNWRLTYVDGTNTVSPTRGGVFNSPTTGATLNFTGVYYLHSSLFVAGDTATSWYLTLPRSVTPTATVGVTPP
jgi:hypothetical protein